MLNFSLVVTLFVGCVLSEFASLNGIEIEESCTVTSYAQLNDVVLSCVDIVIRGISVPAGVTLELNLQDNATVTFEGRITFEYEEWSGHLVIITGNGITVQGTSGHVFDGQGSRYWDGLGSNGGKTKPKFFQVKATGGSVFKNINLLNCPKHCVSITGSQDVTLSNWSIDTSAGDQDQIAHNTDGFDISSSKNVLIENAIVRNQDDCVVVNGGADMKFTGIACYGGHGLSISVGLSKTDGAINTVSNITFSDCAVQDSRNGIHIKTHADAAAGYIRNVTYSNIKFKGITVYGILIQEDYENGSPTGLPVANIPITDLNIKNVEGTLASSYSASLYILCADGGCSNWRFSDISIAGNEI